MPPVRLDMSASNFTVLPAGDYPATITGWKLGKPVKTGNTKGSPRVEVTYALDQGGKVWDRYIIHPDTFWTFKRAVVAAGYDADALSGERDIIFRYEEDDYADLDDPLIIDDVLDEVLGSSVILTLRVKPAEGEYAEKNEVAKIRADDSGTVADAWPKKAA